MSARFFRNAAVGYSGLRDQWRDSRLRINPEYMNENPLNPLMFNGYYWYSPTARGLGKGWGMNLSAWNIPIPIEGRFVGAHARKIIHDITRNSSGAVLGGCTVKAFRTDNDTLVQTVISDAATGEFWMDLPTSDNHYLVMYKTGSPDVAGTSVNTLTGS